MDIGETTVLVGPNNAGKTAILDALRLALTRRWGKSGSGFSEYDIHLTDDKADPKTSTGISIELRSEERELGEWPNTITASLGDIVQLDPNTGRQSVTLRTRCAWSEETGALDQSWEFLDTRREPLAGRSARRINLERFWRYLPVFYLGALRDAKDEFSMRSSQFWRRLLDSLNIPSEIESEALEVLDQLNRRLLETDPRLEGIADTLSGATRIAARDRDGDVNLRMVPLKTWDLLSRAEIILRNETESPWLPLQRQGQGIQSLSVIFLFHAFVDQLLQELYEQGSSPVLTLEEPETHLHPQAVRTLWHHVSALPGQKIVTTHSPYFVQHVPFRDLRIVRLTANGTEVRSLPASFSTSIPPMEDLVKYVNGSSESKRMNRSSGSLSYKPATETLTVHGKLDQKTYRKLIHICCGAGENVSEYKRKLLDLRDRSSLYIDDDELQSLETWGRRMRGEIFFSERWLIVEGQADYLIVHAMAHALGYDLDQHGVSVIDAQNNGNPATFAALAQAFGIPWLAVFDGDQAGQNYVQAIEKRVSSDTESRNRCRTHPDGDLETQLVADRLGPELREILANLNRNIHEPDKVSDEKLINHLRQCKVDYAAEFAERVSQDASLAQRSLEAFRDAIEGLRGLT